MNGSDENAAPKLPQVNPTACHSLLKDNEVDSQVEQHMNLSSSTDDSWQEEQSRNLLPIVPQVDPPGTIAAHHSLLEDNDVDSQVEQHMQLSSSTDGSLQERQKENLLLALNVPYSTQLHGAPARIQSRSSSPYPSLLDEYDVDSQIARRMLLSSCFGSRLEERDDEESSPSSLGVPCSTETPLDNVRSENEAALFPDFITDITTHVPGTSALLELIAARPQLPIDTNLVVFHSTVGSSFSNAHASSPTGIESGVLLGSTRAEIQSSARASEFSLRVSQLGEAAETSESSTDLVPPTNIVRPSQSREDILVAALEKASKTNIAMSSALEKASKINLEMSSALEKASKTNLEMSSALKKASEANLEMTRALRSFLMDAPSVASTDVSTTASSEASRETSSNDTSILDLLETRASAETPIAQSPMTEQGQVMGGMQEQPFPEFLVKTDVDNPEASYAVSTIQRVRQCVDQPNESNNESIEQCWQDDQLNVNIDQQKQNNVGSILPQTEHRNKDQIEPGKELHDVLPAQAQHASKGRDKFNERLETHLVLHPSYNFRQIAELIASLKHKHKLISREVFVKNLGLDINLTDIDRDLRLLSDLGTIQYYNDSDVLSRYIILKPDLEEKVLECFLGSITSRALRRSKSDSGIIDDVERTLGGEMSSLPLFKKADIEHLFAVSIFTLCGSQEANGQWLSESGAIDFVTQILKRNSRILPLELDTQSQSTQEYFFVPSLVAHLEEKDSVWSHKSWSWETTLSHIWLISSAAPTTFTADLSAFLLGKVYKFVKDKNSRRKKFQKSESDPLIRRMSPRKKTHKAKSCEECVSINQFSCWGTALLIEIATTSAEESGESVTSVAHIFVSLVDHDSMHFVGRDENASCEKMGLIVSGRSFEAHQGQRLWEGGYKVVVEAIRSFFLSHSCDYWVRERVACPECLCCLPPSKACTWSWESALEFTQQRVADSQIRCPRGHWADMHMICGKSRKRPFLIPGESQPLSLSSMTPVHALSPGTVLVCLYDKRKKQYTSAGSGFIVDNRNGLIVTAAHVLFDMNEGESFGTPLARETEVRIGVVQDRNGRANMEYVADIIAKDLRNMDACVLQIQNDNGCSPILCDGVSSLEMTTKYEQNESVLLFGFDQGGGGGVYEPGAHLNQVVESVRGYIAKTWSPSAAKKSVSSRALNPRQEIVAYCPTINGQSGGPFVTNEGKVVGILSRSDPLDSQRCYIVPSKEIEKLVTTAKYELLNKQLLDKSSTKYFGKI